MYPPNNDIIFFVRCLLSLEFTLLQGHTTLHEVNNSQYGLPGLDELMNYRVNLAQTTSTPAEIIMLQFPINRLMFQFFPTFSFQNGSVN